MKCANCGCTMQKVAQSVFGFKICQECVDIGNLQEQELRKGIEIELEDPKTGQITKRTYKL